MSKVRLKGSIEVLHMYCIQLGMCCAYLQWLDPQRRAQGGLHLRVKAARDTDPASSTLLPRSAMSVSGRHSTAWILDRQAFLMMRLVK